MKIRIAIQEIDGKKFKHLHNIMCETNDLEFIVKKIRDSIQKEIEIHLLNWQDKKISEKLINELNDDLIDFNSKGYDISKEEFLENEMLDF